MASSSTELDRFVRDALLAGKSRDAIREVLQRAGWTPEQLNGILDDYADVDFPVPVPKPRPSLSARDAFLYLVLFSLLYFLCYHLGSLLFDLVNAALPDPADYGMRYRFFESTRFSTSALLITFPLFAWMAHLLGRETERAPIKRFSPVRRWLTYLTLFFTTGMLVGDLTSLVYNVLGGELTLRFVLKVLVVALISGSVFAYYLWDLRRDESQTQAWHAMGKRLLIVAAVVAIAALVGGFLLIGGPGHQRDLRMDERRTSDLRTLQSAIEMHASTNHDVLPRTLDEVAKKPGMSLSVRDPQSGAPYGYQQVDATHYKLCATFATDSAEQSGRGRWSPEMEWPHAVGQTCFDRTIELKRSAVADAAAAAAAAASAAAEPAGMATRP